MPKIDPWYIFDALAAFVFAEVQQGSPLAIDPDDENSVKDAFRQWVRPRVEAWKRDARESLRLSLAHYRYDKEELDYILATHQDFSMSPPSDVCRFFHWLWEVLYPNEDIAAVDVSGILVDDTLQ